MRNKDNLIFIMIMKRMLTKHIFCIVLLLMCSVCKNDTQTKKNYYLYTNMVELNKPPYLYTIPRTFPLISVTFRLADKQQIQDSNTFDALLQPLALCDSTLKTNDSQIQHLDSLYKILIEENNTIDVNLQSYNHFRKWEVIEDNYIKDLYEKKGIIALLNMYLGSNGEIATWVPILRYGKDSLQYKWYGKDINYKYIISLASKENIYFQFYYHHSNDISGYYISETSSDKAKIEQLLYYKAKQHTSL